MSHLIAQARWDAAYSDNTFDGHRDANNQARYKVIGGLLEEGERVLDVGCGLGHLRPYAPADYTGVDVSKEAITQAMRRFDTGTFLCTDAATYDVGRFDTIVLNEVLYYFDDPAVILRHYQAMVIPGGSLIVSIYDRQTRFWQSNSNRRALRITKRFAAHNLEQEIPVEQNGKKWTVLVIHCQ